MVLYRMVWILVKCVTTFHQAKIGETDKALAEQCIERLDDYIRTHCVTIEEFAKYSRFGLNKRLIDYYEETTF